MCWYWDYQCLPYFLCTGRVKCIASLILKGNISDLDMKFGLDFTSKSFGNGEDVTHIDGTMVRLIMHLGWQASLNWETCALHYSLMELGTLPRIVMN